MSDSLGLLPFILFFIYSLRFIVLALLIRLIFIPFKKFSYHLKNFCSVSIATVIFVIYQYATKLSWESLDTVFNPVIKISIILPYLLLFLLLEIISFLTQAILSAKLIIEKSKNKYSSQRNQKIKF